MYRLRANKISLFVFNQFYCALLLPCYFKTKSYLLKKKMRKYFMYTRGSYIYNFSFIYLFTFVYISFVDTLSIPIPCIFYEIVKCCIVKSYYNLQKLFLAIATCTHTHPHEI